MNQSSLIEMLVRHEGERLKPYVDCCSKSWRDCRCVNKGKLTIGVGRNLEDVGITLNESRYLLENDMGRVRRELDEAVPWWRETPISVQVVLLNLGFNLGVLTPPDTAKLLTFTQTLSMIRSGRYVEAANNLKKTLWHKQVGTRAEELEELLASAAVEVL